ncbi:hypothetical protein PINS_up006824 [Pythium insidiosum]|nr:hypothetical protein PINS_up006824 [Pythium insidiosum]
METATSAASPPDAGCASPVGVGGSLQCLSDRERDNLFRVLAPDARLAVQPIAALHRDAPCTTELKLVVTDAVTAKLLQVAWLSDVTTQRDTQSLLWVTTATDEHGERLPGSLPPFVTPSTAERSVYRVCFCFHVSSEAEFELMSRTIAAATRLQRLSLLEISLRMEFQMHRHRVDAAPTVSGSASAAATSKDSHRRHSGTLVASESHPHKQLLLLRPPMLSLAPSDARRPATAAAAEPTRSPKPSNGRANAVAATMNCRALDQSPSNAGRIAKTPACVLCGSEQATRAGAGLGLVKHPFVLKVTMLQRKKKTSASSSLLTASFVSVGRTRRRRARVQDLPATGAQALGRRRRAAAVRRSRDAATRLALWPLRRVGGRREERAQSLRAPALSARVLLCVSQETHRSRTGAFDSRIGVAREIRIETVVVWDQVHKVWRTKRWCCPNCTPDDGELPPKTEPAAGSAASARTPSPSASMQETTTTTTTRKKKRRRQSETLAEEQQDAAHQQQRQPQPQQLQPCGSAELTPQSSQAMTLVDYAANYFAFVTGRENQQPPPNESEDVCFCCRDGGDLIECDWETRRGVRCPKVYHEGTPQRSLSLSFCLTI